MKITLDYLKGITDALYYSQTPLLGGEIEDEKEFEINRSLNGSALNSVLNLASPSWDSLVEMMYKDYLDFKANNNTLNGRSICLN